MTVVNKSCIDLIKSFEGLSLVPYYCSANVPTIGYGTTRYPNGRKVGIKDGVITEAKALDFLMYDIHEKAKSVDALLRDDLTENQFGALISFAYNLGEGSLKQSSLRVKVNNNPSDAAIKKEFEKWVYADGKKLAGLLTRRKAEAILYFS